ncbi:MAG: two-component sensor histidine kinase, partial [Gammaproteobacteria bacterium]
MLSATLLLLLVAFALIASALLAAFRQSAEQSLNERLLSDIYGLLAAVEITPQGEVRFPQQFPQFRLLQSESELIAEVVSAENHSIWQSLSMGERRLPLPPEMAMGETLTDSPLINGEHWYRSTLAVSWEISADHSRLLRFSVAEKADALQAEVEQFRNTLFIGLGATTLLVLMVEALVLRWGLKPLSRAVAEVDQVRTGRRQQLSDGYPVEISSLTQSLNALLQRQRTSLDRYRNALGDAAHSIKTPLAALKNGLINDAENLQQVNNLDRIVEYHLKKAATAGPLVLREPVAVAPLVEQLVNSLKKVYAEKELQWRVDIQPEACFPGDGGDFLELLGNLLDNACKWADSEVGCLLELLQTADATVLRISVTDDGPGISPE